jgi:hypothetical protein
MVVVVVVVLDVKVLVIVVTVVCVFVVGLTRTLVQAPVPSTASMMFNGTLQ